jgi:tetratricopeptide (TPR) repeat protein
MKCRYTKYLLWFTLGAIISLVIYTRFFSENIADNWQHLHHQAHIALHNEKYEHVIEICDQAIQPNTSPINRYFVYVKKAKALNKLHRYEEALKSSDLAIAIYPKKEEAYLAQVDALFNLGLEEELITVLEEIVSINPHTPLKPLLNSLRLERGKVQYQ